jgi:hypothetical protein
VAADTVIFSEPQPGDVAEKENKQKGKKFGKSYSDHFSAPLFFQLIT